MFEYFSDNPSWSSAVVLALSLGGEMDEVDRVCQRMKPLNGHVSHADGVRHWIRCWQDEAERIERLAATDERSGRMRGAGRKLLRAAAYRIAADRYDPPSAEKRASYARLLATFRSGVALTNPEAQFVTVPWQGHQLAAIFLPARGMAGRAPCLIQWPGGDANKEWMYLWHAYDLADYGVSMLLVDRPGSGEAKLNELKFHHDSESDAAACIDYLITRDDVDPERIGLCDASLGGYFAPRAAAFEKRIKCVVAWGAIWDWWQVLTEGLLQGAGPAARAGMSAEDFVSRVEWILCWPVGAAGIQDYLRTVRQWNLAGVAEQITCPILIVHGENDSAVPLSMAQETYDACVNSPRRELKVFTAAEGGVEHCQVDNVTLATDYIYPWVSEVLSRRTADAQVERKHASVLASTVAADHVT